MSSSSTYYSAYKSSSAYYKNLIKSSTGPSAFIYKAMVAYKVFPFLLYTIFSIVEAISDLVITNNVAIKIVIANYTKTLIFLLFSLFSVFNY